MFVLFLSSKFSENPSVVVVAGEMRPFSGSDAEVSSLSAACRLRSKSWLGRVSPATRSTGPMGGT